MSALMGPEGANAINAAVEKLEQLKGLIDMVSPINIHDFVAMECRG
jgi:hypothetical protein